MNKSDNRPPVQAHPQSAGMSPPSVTACLMMGSVMAAWLRFDVGSLILGWSVVLIGILGAIGASMFRAGRLPAIDFPPKVRELGARDELTSEEDAQFADALRAWHRQQQQDAWREIERKGPVVLIGSRAAFYFLWLSVSAVVLLPQAAVPGVLPQLPRVVMVLLPLAIAAAAIATPFGIRDWRRIKKELSGDDTPSS